MSDNSNRLLERAREYAGLLGPGSEIIDDTDGDVVRDFRHLLPALLFRRGLYLERTPRGVIVTDQAPWKAVPRVLAIECRRCNASWFDCEHGQRAVVVVSSIVPPVLPILNSRQRAYA